MSSVTVTGAYIPFSSLPMSLAMSLHFTECRNRLMPDITMRPVNVAKAVVSALSAKAAIPVIWWIAGLPQEPNRQGQHVGLHPPARLGKVTA